MQTMISFWQWLQHSTDRTARIEALAFAVASSGITIAAADITDPVSVVGMSIVVPVGAVPYATGCALSGVRPHRFSRYSARVAILCYGVFDAWVRCGALLHPKSSTDAVVAFALPIIWAPVIMLASVLLVFFILGVWSAIARENRLD